MTQPSVLVTGAGGKTGQAVVAALVQRGVRVRAGVRTATQGEQLLHAGAAEAVTLDLLDPAAMATAMRGAPRVYHICPNVHPQEIEIGRALIDAANAAGVEHLVYHSVLRPQTEKMPHHWRKLRVEEMLQESSLTFTILQPTAYMQNILAGRQRIIEAGVYAVPYSPTTAISLVDLHDVAAAAAHVLSTAGHEFAVYEVCGTPPLSQHAIAAALARALNRPVRAQVTPIEAWREAAAASLAGDRIDSLTRMFAFYAAYGLRGNPNVLAWLLGRPPLTLDEFCTREFGGDHG